VLTGVAVYVDLERSSGTRRSCVWQQIDAMEWNASTRAFISGADPSGLRVVYGASPSFSHGFHHVAVCGAANMSFYYT
jgi:hypothetical protein